MSVMRSSSRELLLEAGKGKVHLVTIAGCISLHLRGGQWCGQCARLTWAGASADHVVTDHCIRRRWCFFRPRPSRRNSFLISSLPRFLWKDWVRWCRLSQSTGGWINKAMRVIKYWGKGLGRKRHEFSEWWSWFWMKMFLPTLIMLLEFVGGN